MHFVSFGWGNVIYIWWNAWFKTKQAKRDVHIYTNVHTAFWRMHKSLSLELWRITSMEFGMLNCFIFFVFWQKFIAFQAVGMTNRTGIKKQQKQIQRLREREKLNNSQMILEWLITNMAKFIFWSVSSGWLKIITISRSQWQPKNGNMATYNEYHRLFDDSAKYVALSRIENKYKFLDCCHILLV